MAYLLEGNAYAAVGKHNDAIESYKKSIKHDSKFVIAHFNMGNTLFTLQRFNEALNEYDQGLKINSNFALAHNQKGNVFSAMGRIEDAKAEYNSAIKSDPSMTVAHFSRGNLFLKMQNFKEAHKSYDDAIKTNPQFIQVYLQKASVYIQQKLYDKAIAWENDTLQKFPNCLPVLAQKLDILRLSGKIDEAAACEQILLRLSRAEIAVCDAADKLAFAGQLHAALGLYNKAIEINPDFVDAYINKANVLSALKNTEDELKCYEDALKHTKTGDPKLSWIYNNKSVALLNSGRNAEAKAVLEETLRLDANNVNVLNNLGNVYLAMDDKKEAIKYYDRALTIDPNFINASTNKLLILLALERQKTAAQSKNENEVLRDEDSALSDTASQASSDMSLEYTNPEPINTQNLSKLVLAHQHNIPHLHQALSDFITQVRESQNDSIEVITRLLALLDGTQNWPNEVSTTIIDTLREITIIVPGKIQEIVETIVAKLKLGDMIEAGYMSQILCVMVKSDIDSMLLIKRHIEPLREDENDVVCSEASKIFREIKKIGFTKDAATQIPTPPSTSIPILDPACDPGEEKLSLFTQGLNSWKILSNPNRIKDTTDFLKLALEQEQDELTENNLLKYQIGIIAIRAQDLNLFRSIINLPDIDLNWTPTQHSQTLLYTLASSIVITSDFLQEYNSVIEEMLAKGANPFVIVNGITALHASIEQQNSTLINIFVQWHKSHEDRISGINHSLEHQIMICNEVMFNETVEQMIRDIIDIGYSPDQISSDNDQVIKFIGKLDQGE